MSNDLASTVRDIVEKITPAVAMAINSKDATTIRLHFSPGGKFSGGKIELSL